MKSQKRMCQLQSCCVLSCVNTLGFGDAGLGLSPYGPIQSVLVWWGPVWCFICESKTTSHI